MQAWLEAADELVVEVVALYDASIVDVAHVRSSYRIGEGPDNDLTTTGEALGDPESFAIVRAEAGGYWIDFTAAMRGSLREGGRERSFASLIADGLAMPEAGHHSVPLRPEAEVRIELGRLQFHIRLVTHEPVEAERAAIDRPLFGYLGSTATIGLLLLGLMGSIPPEALAIEQAELSELPRVYRLATQVDDDPVPKVVAVITSKTPSYDRRHGGGRDEPALRGRTGAAGADRVAEQRRPSPERNEPTLRSRTAKPVDMRQDQPFDLGVASGSAGLLGLAGDYAQRFADMSPRAYTVDVDDHEVWRDMTRGELGEAYGVAGLGLIGIGRGGGGYQMSGRIDGGGQRPSRPLCGPHCNRRQQRPKREWIPTLHIGEVRVDGNLESYEVRKLLRKHQAEVVACVAKHSGEQQHRSDTLTINFAIAPNGAVATAVIDDTSLENRELARCITRAFERWKFPASPTGETVLVVHEFGFRWNAVR